MATATTTGGGTQADAQGVSPRGRLRDPSFFAFAVLWLGFIAAPLVAGIDKFFNAMTDWDQYLWVGFADNLPGSATQLMYLVGAIEVVAAVIVLVAPRIGGWIVAGWLAGVVTNLVIVATTTGAYWDIALRDVGLMLGAIALALLAQQHGPRWPNRQPVDLTEESARS